MSKSPVIVFHPHRSDGVRLQGETINTLTSFMGTGGLNMSMVAVGDECIRKITPEECELLQGFPLGFTSSEADTHRYKQLGNAVTVYVTEWLGKRI